GAYHPADGPIFAHGTAGDDTITASTVDGIVTFTFSPGGGPVDVPLFPPEDVTGIRVRMHAGDDMVTGSGFGDLILGGPGSDTLFGEAGRDTMDGGPGNDRVFGGDDFDRLFDSEGDDLVDTGGPVPFGGTVNGIPGSDNIYVGAGQDTLSFDDAVLPITMDASNPNMQTVDADGNRVQATGFNHFIGTPFNDQFSIGGDVPLLFTFDGGLGSDTLTVDAKGLPTVNDGKRVQVMGFEPIEYTNFDRINIVNALPWVKADLEDHLVIDKNGNGKADPGDTLEYVVTIANDGLVDARNLLFEDTLDPNMELATGLLNISPIALDDIYVVRGPLSVNSSSGLLANDFDIDGSVPGTNADLVVDVGSVTRISDPTTSTFTAQPDGSFAYTPEPGFSGMETFTYSITDTDGMIDVGAVHLIVNDVVWFVDNSLLTNGDGSLNHPFNSLAPVNGSDGLDDMDGPGDTIFVFGGTGVYNQGFELEDNQSLIGEGHGLFLGGRTLVMPGPRPTLTNTTGDGIMLASNNTVRGLNIDGAAGANIRADGAQRGQIQDVSLSGGSTGIDLHNTGGTFTFTNVSISDPTGTVFNVEGGTSKVAFGADSTIRQSTSTGSGLHFTNANGTYNFNGGVTLDGGNAGINIMGGDVSLLLPKLSITHTGTNPVVDIRNHSRGTVNLRGLPVGGVLTLVDGQRMRFDNADGTYDFNGQVTLNGDNAGIDILGGSSGTFTFPDTDITHSGSGSAVNINDHSGGTVTFGSGSTFDATGGTGLQFDNADGIYHFNGEVTLNGGDAGIDILGGSSGTFTFSDTTITDPSGAGLNVENSRPNITFDGITVRGGTNGIRFEGVTGDFTVIGNTVIDNTTGASIT
ncbi:MAG: cadherin-like domain-containing protein, partial [Planctomycetales bacterium]|nr:cadherin-like domain-containing protein [Planctomycetales bacterium]